MTVDSNQVSEALAAALEGVVPDPAAVVEDLHLPRFVNDAGELDETAVTALADRYRTLTGRKPAGGREQGKAEAERRFGKKEGAARERADAVLAKRFGVKPERPAQPLTARERGRAEARRRFGPPPGDAA